MSAEINATSGLRARKFWEVEMKASKSRKNNHGNSNHLLREKRNLAKLLGGLWRDLRADPHWKYRRLSPVQVLEILELQMYPMDNDELARATWFWSRRPRLLPAASCIAWLSVTLGLPFWLFLFPCIGVPVLLIAAVTVNTEIVRSVQWRRQYELSIDRLIRTSRTGADSSGLDVFV